MKKYIKLFILLFIINGPLLLTAEKTQAQVAVSFQSFYDDLSPYGTWFNSPDYGYVWRPQSTGFVPYSTGGYWALTDAGWTWISDYSWGWAPFHYGRWYYDDFNGYVWVPGYEWGPGWVTWRRSDDYYGWAPLGPGININVGYSNTYNVPYNRWNFVRSNYFGRRDLHNYYVDRSRNVTIINNTTVINNTITDRSRNSTYTPGPDRTEVQRRIGRKIEPVAIVDAKTPVQQVTNKTVQLYRPIIQRTSNTAENPAPKQVVPLAANKQAAEKTGKLQKTEVIDNRTGNSATKQPVTTADQPAINAGTRPQEGNRTDRQVAADQKAPEDATRAVKQVPLQQANAPAAQPIDPVAGTQGATQARDLRVNQANTRDVPVTGQQTQTPVVNISPSAEARDDNREPANAANRSTAQPKAQTPGEVKDQRQDQTPTVQSPAVRPQRVEAPRQSRMMRQQGTQAPVQPQGRIQAQSQRQTPVTGQPAQRSQPQYSPRPQRTEQQRAMPVQPPVRQQQGSASQSFPRPSVSRPQMQGQARGRRE